MNKVSVLVEGYAREWRASGWQTSSSTVLVQTDKINIVCDPGINQELLTDGLKKNNLSFEDINYVFLAHEGVEASYGMAWFPKAKLLDFQLVYFDGDKEEQHHNRVLGNGLEIVYTPGHGKMFKV